MKTVTYEPAYASAFKTRAPGQYSTDAISEETGLRCEDPSLASQDEAKECDINTLIQRFGLDYTMPQIEKLPINADFVDNISFQEAQNAIREATETFALLHANIRKRFGHDPAEFVDFCSDPANLEELRKMKLAPEPAPPAPKPEPVTVRIQPEPIKETGKPVT